MRKKYILSLTIIILCFIFLFISYLSNNKHDISIMPIDSFSQKTTIQFISSWAAYDTKSTRLKTVLKNFSNNYPDIEIVNKSMAGEDFLFVLKTDFASGNDPHVFGLWPGSDFRLLVEQEKVADLTDLLKENPVWYDQFREATWDYVTVDERIYGLPLEIIYEGLFINRDLFEKYNVKIPASFEELLEAIRIFKGYGITPIAYNATPEGSYIYQNIVMKLGGKEDVEHPFDEEGRIKPCYIEGMYYMKALYESGAFPQQALLLDDKTRNDLFINKQAAMIVQGSWFIGDNALSSHDSTVDIIPFPMIEGGKAHESAIIYGCGNGIFHISQKAWEDGKIKEACVLLLKELTAVKTAKLLADDSGFISNINLPRNMKETASMTKKGEELVQNAKELVGPVDSFIDRGIWENIVVQKFPQVLEGKILPEEVFEQVEEVMTNKIKRNNP
ncbi:ABC transporter substrate-binding protein [Cellulosilyticum sp. I15G10I2]|uniref:ABC transporter substrate-binding protein n=1 Tax=Cellulosilyticum sp. I15G10I2 TaxID=1892843 RepID=UPI00085BD0EB|nr:extracellular solute-binding protein [Cellulosilyticum sp. I15G10I2]